MKKLYVLIPSLVATVSTPLISMVGCDDPNTKQWLVQFNTNGGSFIDSVRVEDGKTIKKPADPTQKGYQFDGWFKDADFQDDFDFSEPIKSNLTIYVRWKKDAPTNTITFSTDGNCLLEFQTLNVTTGTKWSELVASGKLPKLQSIRSGYDFDGWYLDNKKLEDTDETKIDSDWFINVRFAASLSRKAYVSSEITGIELSNPNVTLGQKYETDITRAGKEIKIGWVQTILNGSTDVVGTITQKDEYTLHLVIDEALGDITIIINDDKTNYYSFLCSNPDEGYTITENKISASSPLVGVIHSANNTIDKEGAISKITINGIEIDPNNYSYEVSKENPNEASIYINNLAINGNVLIWIAPLTIDYDWDIDGEDYPYTIDPLPEGTPIAEAEGKFYDWIADNRKNYVNDFIVTEFFRTDSLSSLFNNKDAEEGRFTIQVSNLNTTVSEDKLIKLNLNMTVSMTVPGPDGTIVSFTTNLEAINIYAKLKYDREWYVLYPAWVDMSDEESLNFLKNNPWSMTMFEASSMGHSASETIDSQLMQTIELEQWQQGKEDFAELYEAGCLYHQIYYLKNIHPESK